MDSDIVGGACGDGVPELEGAAKCGGDAPAVVESAVGRAVRAALRRKLRELEVPESEMAAELGCGIDEAPIGEVAGYLARLDWYTRRLALAHVSDQ
jgi:hypothetical protein